MQEKSDCWTQWMKNHTYGQTRNRIDYAADAGEGAARGAGDADRRGRDERGAGRGDRKAGMGQDEPVTTDVYATPPKTMSEAHDAGTPEKGVGEAASGGSHGAAVWTPQVAPGEGCTDRCRTTWHTCRTTCEAKACGICDATYSRCMKGCF